MRLALESTLGIHLVRRYGAGEIVIGEQRLTEPFIVGPQRLVLDWGATSIPELSEGQLEPLLQEAGVIVLLGAGELQPMPSATLRRRFQERSVALECMNLGAACRTYNVLAQEQRPVLAGLFP